MQIGAIGDFLNINDLCWHLMKIKLNYFRSQGNL